MIERFMHLFDYNDWANNRTLNSIPSDKYDTREPLGIFSHLIISQIHWLDRITEPKLRYKSFWELLAIKEALVLSSDSTEEWRNFLRNTSEDGLLDTCSYKNSKGEHFQNTVQDIITHVLNHSTYHRAQIASWLRKNGGEPVSTDYIVFVR